MPRVRILHLRARNDNQGQAQGAGCIASKQLQMRSVHTSKLSLSVRRQRS